MSKKDNIKSELNSNSIVSGFIAPKETDTEPKQKKEITNTNIKQSASDEIKTATKRATTKAIDIALNGYKYKNGKNRDINTTTSFKLDADIEDYFNKIEIINFITTASNGNIQEINKIDYLNGLIRDDLKKRLNIKANETDPNKWINAYDEYKKKYGIK